jgi:hypothetical protein
LNRIVEQMTSFFCFFLHQGGTRCPQRVGKANAAFCRLNLISSNASRAMRRRSCAFGGWFWHRLRPPPPRLRRARGRSRSTFARLVKRMRLCRLNLNRATLRGPTSRRSCAFGGWFWHRLRRSRSTSTFTYEWIDHPPPVFRFRAQTGSHRILPNVIHLC